MNVLTQRNLTNLDVKGSVKLNGKTANVNNITALSAYVQQDDLFISTLTVREHLRFHSRVRMDQSTPEHIRNDRVEQVVQDVSYYSWFQFLFQILSFVFSWVSLNVPTL